MSRRTATASPHTLRNYALLADGERGVLVDPDGRCVWMCAPRWDSDAVLSEMIGGIGHYSITPVSRFVSGGYYEQRSLIWCSRWITDAGVVECREALAFPGDPHRAILMRRVIAQEEPARIHVCLSPTAGFDQYGMRALKLTADGDWCAQAGELFLRWHGAPDAVPTARGRGRGLEMELTAVPGAPLDLVLEISDEKLPAGSPSPNDLWAATQAAWHRQVPHMDQTIAPRDASHSFAVMRGLTGSAGGMVAAATTSLPERAEAGRNYDYRYVWIRDQCYAVQAAAAAGQEQWCDHAVRFVIARLLEHGPSMAPAYTVDGRRIPTSRRIDLPGYPGGYDQVGNHVSDQFQLDAFGESLLALAAAARVGQLDLDGHRAVDLAVRAIAERWQEPDTGVWELAPRRWAHSRLSCAAGLRAIASSGFLGRGSARCIELADRLVAEADRTCLHPSGRWQRAPEDDRVDGALLLPALRGAIPADDPRSTATLEAFISELTDDHFAYRYRHDGRPLGEAEGSFLLCGFLTALALHQQGEHVEAARWFERTHVASGHSGLYAEEYDVTQRQLRGNLPQAFVHALMLESAVRLSGPWR